MKPASAFPRREFLRRAVTAAAGITLPSIIPASVLAHPRNISPNERIRMGFIGVGTQGGGHLLGGAWTYVAGGYAGRKEVQVMAVCDVWKDRREQACRKVNEHYAAVVGKAGHN